MIALLWGLGVILAGGAIAAALWRTPRWSSLAAVSGCVAGAACGLAAAVANLLRGETDAWSMAGSLPGLRLDLLLDPLAAFFLIPIFLLSAAAAVYGHGYLAGSGRRGALSWPSYNLLVASMAVVTLAHNGLLFILAWEAMALASFLLVMLHCEDADVRRAGWTYLVASHAGTALLLAMFCLLASQTGSFGFDGLVDGGLSRRIANLVWALACVGFGVKAGFMPLHVWLPRAHPAAPAHVSAVMSGVMIKTGIYGILRVSVLVGPAQPWWGWVLVAIGVSSGVLGVLFALAQHDLKRLLAYSSVENIGIIALGLGLGFVGVASGSPLLAVLGFAGGLLHVLNHALFKGLLFLGAGAVQHACGTLHLDRLGGLLRRMPMTGALFLLGSAAICGLPPLNGFVSELLIYAACFQEGLHGGASTGMLAVAALAALALIGGLAMACFVKAAGIVFLGEPRTPAAQSAHEVGLSMRAPMLALATGCVALGLLPGAAVRVLEPVLVQVSGLAWPATIAATVGAVSWLSAVTLSCAALLALVVAFALVRRAVLRRRARGSTGTWDCGYAAPSARMQYTAASFADPLLRVFAPLLRTRRHTVPPDGLFPRAAALETETPDLFEESLFRPLFACAENLLSRLRVLQHGRIHAYVLVIAIVLVALLLWKL